MKETIKYRFTWMEGKTFRSTNYYPTEREAWAELYKQLCGKNQMQWTVITRCIETAREKAEEGAQ